VARLTGAELTRHDRRAMNLAMRERSLGVGGGRWPSLSVCAASLRRAGRGRAASAVALSAACLFGLSACGEDAASSSPSAGGAAGQGGAGGGAASGGSVSGGSGGDADCERTGAEAADAVCVGYVRGNVIDEGGAPLGSASVSVCGPACFYGETDSVGDFLVDVRS